MNLHRLLAASQSCHVDAAAACGDALDRLDTRERVDARSDAHLHNALRMVLAFGQRHREHHATMALIAGELAAGIELDGIEDEHCAAASGDCDAGRQAGRAGAAVCETELSARARESAA